MKRRQLLAAFFFCFVAARASTARAGGDGPSVEGNETGDPSVLPAPVPPSDQQPPSESQRSILETYYPPPVDGPELRLPESPTRLYLDGAYASSGDLSALQLSGERLERPLRRRRRLALAPLRVRR